MKFSQRIGVTPITKEIQLQSMDSDLKNSLWNVLVIGFIEHLRISNRLFAFVFEGIWVQLFKLPVDEIPHFTDDKIAALKNWFFSADWYKVYDLIDFIVDIEFTDRKDITTHLMEHFNDVLKTEASGYRFVDNKLAPITNNHELEEIEAAITTTQAFSPLSGANIHLQFALEKLSDRKSPDYRNSIKEAISAVEAVVKVISGKNKDSLGNALSKLKDKLGLHSALERGFKQIYGYTSDSDGIRHALMGEPNVDFEDAKYMLVSCSAFINYLIVKAQKASIALN